MPPSPQCRRFSVLFLANRVPYGQKSVLHKIRYRLQVSTRLLWCTFTVFTVLTIVLLRHDGFSWVAKRSRPQSPALACLLKDRGREQYFEYPQDAESHFDEMHTTLAALYNFKQPHTAAGYSGPWIENVWISHFENKITNTRASGGQLRSVFGAYIPLLIPWVDLWVNANPTPYRYPPKFVQTLLSQLRPNVLYVTVSQSDSGLRGPDGEFTESEISNILVLNAGGYGHVPIPLLKNPMQTCAPLLAKNRNYFAVFPGTIVGHDPRHVREAMNESVSKFGTDYGVNIHLGLSQDWQRLLCDSRFTLCPRGFGRTSYRIAETLQMGRVPIYVYSDVPWIPYKHLFRHVGFVVHISELHTLLKKVSRISQRQLNIREQRALRLAKSHFSYEAVMSQIERFLLNEANDLRCEKLPSTIRDE